jgi:uncharacterized membrane protein
VSKRARIHRRETLGEHLADAMVTALGSWGYIVAQTVVVLVWALGNLTGVFRFDPMPFILLNLFFSTQASYASPLILMAANRQAARDRRRDDLEAEEVESIYALNLEQHQIMGQQRDEIVLLRQINAQQLEILQALHGVMRPADA